MSGSAGAQLRFTRAQRRHLEVSLGHILDGIEEAFVGLQRWPFPGHRQEMVLRELKALEDRVHEFAGGLGLSPSDLRSDPRQRLEALASEWWSTALDCRSEVLRGYGEVDPSTGPCLDPLVEDLATALLNVGRFSRGHFPINKPNLTGESP